MFLVEEGKTEYSMIKGRSTNWPGGWRKGFMENMKGKFGAKLKGERVNTSS